MAKHQELTRRSLEILAKVNASKYVSNVISHSREKISEHKQVEKKQSEIKCTPEQMYEELTPYDKTEDEDGEAYESL